MKLRQFLHLMREGLRNTWHNRLMALASVGVLVCCLTLTGFAYLIYVNVEQVFRTTEKENTICVYLDDGLSDIMIERVGTKLEGLDNVTIDRYLSKEEFLNEQYKGVLTDEMLESYQGENNPLPNTYIVYMEDLSLFEETLEEIEAVAGVEDIDYDAGLAEKLVKIRGVVMAIGGGIIGVLLIVSLFIIVNTIKLTVHSRRLEIYIMKSVGATDGYVRFPFIVEGLVLGAVAGGLGYGLIALVYQAIIDSLSLGGTWMKTVAFSDQWLPLLVGVMAGGMLVGVCGSAISISKYLRQEGSERV